jgi:TetR/AcrR family transcriptional regulator, tetracycline repressor protein
MAAGSAAPGGQPVPPWQQYAKPERTRQPLSREAIVDAALKIIDEQGFSALSMRAVAQALGTGPASLYAHVANKEQLVDLVMDRVYGEFEVPQPGAAPWQEQVKEFARSGVRALLAHRGLAAATLGGPPMGPNGLRVMEAGLALVRAAGLPDELVAYSSELLGQYMAVAALEQESVREQFGSVPPEQVAEMMNQFGGYLESLPPEQFPNMTSMVRSGTFMSHSDEMDRFELGLDIIIRGLASYAASPPVTQD